MLTLEQLAICPAPWRTFGDGEVYAADCVKPICTVRNMGDEQREAVLASFIAAEPVMYETLARVYSALTAIRDKEREGADVLNKDAIIDTLISDSEKALAKAGGKECEERNRNGSSAG